MIYVVLVVTFILHTIFYPEVCGKKWKEARKSGYWLGMFGAVVLLVVITVANYFFKLF